MWAGPLLKPEKRKRVKGRRKRAEQKVVKSVRAQCVKRDGACIARGVSRCEGPSQWCHYGQMRRSKTTGSKHAPEERHSTTWSFMACKKHHDQYDNRRLPRVGVFPKDAFAGCDGNLQVEEFREPGLTVTVQVTR